jgi:hypothetical protein
MVRKNPFIVGGPRLLAVLILYVVLVVGGAVLGATLERGSPARLGVALLQGLTVTAFVVALFLSIRQLDEMEQRIMYESMALAFAATIIVVAGYGYLERAGLPAMAWGIWVHPLVFLFWAFAWMVVVRRYR